MRRLLAFAMCVSGFTLAVSWTRADEPAATEDAQPAGLPAEPSARPVVTRTEPGEYRNAEESAVAGADAAPESGVADSERAAGRQRLDDSRLRNWMRLYDHFSGQGSAASLVEQQLQRLGKLEESVTQLSAVYQGRALEVARGKIDQEIAVIERFLAEVRARQAQAEADAVERPAKDNAQAVGGVADGRQRLDDARLRNWLRIYERQTQLGVPTIVQQRVSDLAEYYELLAHHEGRDPSSLAQARQEAALIERFLDEVQSRQAHSDEAKAGEEPSTGKPEDGGKAKRPERSAPEQIREMQQRMAELQAQRAQKEADGPVARRLERELERQLERLQRLAGEVEQSAGEEAEAIREQIESKIDAVEQSLKSRREQREAAERGKEPGGAGEAEADPEVRALHERMRHLQAAIEHLNAAGMHDVARNLQEHAENLQREVELRRRARAEREAAQRATEESELQDTKPRERPTRDELRRERERAEAAARDAAAAAERQAGEAFREIAGQVRELRQELRRMRAEIEELRKSHAPPEKE